MQAILGTKIDQTQKFLDDGTRIPVTRLWVAGNTVVFVKTKEKHNYSSVQLGFGIKKNANKALIGHIKGASLKAAPKFLKEIRFEDESIAELPAVGEVINATEVFKPGDIVDAVGISKGKGYAGVVKRHHFKGGPRTHGQSDRERAPGSIGQTTTPGRVYKGKRMAGRMGHERVTIKNLEVVGVSEDTLLIKGLVPGGKNTLIMVTKVGENKKFVPLYGENKEIDDDKQPQISEDAEKDASRQSTSDDAQQAEIEQTIEPVSLSESQQSESEEKSTRTESTFSSSESGLAPIISDNDVRTENEESKKEEVENAG